MSKTFLITGVGGGMGRAFSDAALDQGHRVVGTVRRQEQITELEALAPGRAIGAVLEITDEKAVADLVQHVEDTVAPIDVLICNAGYGLEGTVEETSIDQARHQFDVNVFGSVTPIKAVLPFMRQRRAGNIVTVSSMAGLTALPGVAFYGGSKFAMEGIAASLAQEVAGFGIYVTSLALGAFRTEWAGRSMVRTERSIADYDEVFEPIRAARRAKDGNQTGDPVLAAKALLQVLDAEHPPVHLVLGSDALRLIEQGRKQLADDIAAWTHLSTATDLPAEH